MEGIQLGRILAGQTHAPVVYFMSLYFRDSRAVKIGTSTRLGKRVGNITYGATLSDVLLLVSGDRDVEHAYHQRFREHQIQGEVFRRAGDLAAFLANPPWSAPTSGVPARPMPEPEPFGPIADPRGIPVSLSEAVRHGYAPGATLHALQMDRHRSNCGELPEGLMFPEPAGMRDRKTQLFWPAELSEFNMARRGSWAATKSNPATRQETAA